MERRTGKERARIDLDYSVHKARPQGLGVNVSLLPAFFYLSKRHNEYQKVERKRKRNRKCERCSLTTMRRELMRVAEEKVLFRTQKKSTS